MLAPGLWAWCKFVDVPDDARIVEVAGQQWHWTFRFPGEDGVLGQVSVSEMSVDNPFGMKADDPAGRDDILVNSGELHLPLGESYKFVLRSKDVLHNFTVPQFRVKMDLVPGSTPYAWLKTIRTGRYDILCEELCGIGHFAMRGAVVVEEPAEFDAWLASWPRFADVLQQSDAQPAVGQAQYAVCAACHGAQGEGNQMLNAPRLAGQGAWYIARQLDHFALAHGFEFFGVDDGTLPGQRNCPAGVAGAAAAGNDGQAQFNAALDQTRQFGFGIRGQYHKRVFNPPVGGIGHMADA